MTKSSARRPLLWPLVPAYRLALALRELQLRSGLKLVRRLGWPVVCIGNLSAGGAGKTPMTIALAGALAERGLHVDVLSRGYGRRNQFAARVDPLGAAADFGDEPLLIARATGVPVYVGAERYGAGRLAESESPQAQRGVHLLDDGFQHRQLTRDVNILLVNRADLGDHLLPAGNLREPLRAIGRARIVAIPEDETEVEAELEAMGWKGSVWRLRRRMEVPRVDGPVAAFCGIARPAQFFEGLAAAGLRVAARAAFPDHHVYTGGDLTRLIGMAQVAGAIALITTEKDLVRMGGLAARLAETTPLETARLCVEIENEAAAVEELMQMLSGSRKA